MTTVAEWIETAKDYFLSGAREEQDILAAAIVSTSATTLTVTDATDGIQVGAEIEIDIERMYVRSIVGTTVTVRRGYRGSAPATHLISADIIVNPQVTKAAILRELNNELASLSSPANGVFKVSTADLTWSGSAIGYDLAGIADVESILEVRYRAYGNFDEWPIVEPSFYSLARNMDTAEFSSGLALMFSGGVAPGQAVRVRYSAPFTALTSLSQNVETISGIPSTAIDIPPMGAAINLAAPGDIRRTLEGQGDPRFDQDVPPGSRTNAVRYLLSRRQSRIVEEAARIARDFPVLLRR